jgi:hypothetical protein
VFKRDFTIISGEDNLMTQTSSTDQSTWFSGRSLFIATKHKKEIAIANQVVKALGLNNFQVADIDTDVLGTFAGEVERRDDSLTTLRKKCEMAATLAPNDVVIATEGSFGPHPAFFMLSGHEELMMFLDKKNDLEIVVKEITSQTNFNGRVINNLEDLQHFLDLILFPSHGIIMKAAKDNLNDLKKGIHDPTEMRAHYDLLIAKYGEAYIETDMRAMHNPSRMKVIEELTVKLIDRITTYCPQCQTPGYGIVSANPGLPCELCGTPTNSLLSYTYGCKKCGFSHEEKYPNGKKYEEAMYCDSCNP